MAASHDDDMYLFQGSYEQTPGYPGQAFDDFLETSPTAGDSNSTFLNPNDLTIKKEGGENLQGIDTHKPTSSPPSSSGSSRSSSSIPAKRHLRDVSEASTASQTGVPSRSGAWRSGINGLTMPSNDDLFPDTDMSGFEEDFIASNEQMASDFDFDTAASTPSGLDAAPFSLRAKSNTQPFSGSTGFASGIAPIKGSSPRIPAGQPRFYFGGSRETSPLSAMLPTSQAQSPWAQHSPSSGLEETFNTITMNGDSPGNTTFSQAPQFSANGFSFDPDSSTTPSTFTKDLSSPPSTINSSEGNTQLKVFPTSLKSRVETQIPIKMILSPLPPGVKKLRLPTHTVSKPKFLAKADVEKSPEILELHTSLVCTSAMQDPTNLKRAFSRARGEQLPPLSRASPATPLGSPSSKEDEDRPLNGGEVKICSGCIQRERKRASRKKLKKPEEEEMFQKDEERRVVVFNTNEIKEWVEPSKETPPDGQSTTTEVASALRPGSMQVELPMRIACYCRHQNEKLGFQVIFTIKDYRDNVVAQAITNSIMITDDHKTHNAPVPQPNPSPGLPQAPQFPGAGVFSTSGPDYVQAGPPNPKMFKQSFSTTDLHGLQHNFNPTFPMGSNNQPFVIPPTQSTDTSSTMTPRNLSRPASPNGPSGPTTKRRKQSGSGKVPSTLTMTRLENMQIPAGASTIPNTNSSSYAPNISSFMNGPDRGFAMPALRTGHSGTSPPTPNSHENGFLAGFGRSFSLENLPRQAIISAPSSRQPSRPGSPTSNRNSFGAADPNFSQALTNQLLGQPSRRPLPTIHKVVPAEGTVAGGTEVTLLGNGFYQGLEVMFGDTVATTTTFWGEKCLNCITPPSLQPGMVAVLFKYEHPSYAATQQSTQTRHPVYTYIDDREVEMYRLALKTLGPQLQTPTDNPYAAAQQLLSGGPMQPMWPSPSSYGGMGGHQRQAAGAVSSPSDLIDLESNMLVFLSFLDRKAFTQGRSSLNQARPTGLTLLHLASSLGLTRFAAGLLSRGANPNALDNNGNTPMHHAAMNGHTHIIHRLRLAGADHRIRSIRNFLPADLAISLLAYQATLISRHHYRSRSAGGTPLRLHSRNNSSRSLRSFWEHASAGQTGSDETNTSESDDETFDDMPLKYNQAKLSEQIGKSPSLPESVTHQGDSQLRPPNESDSAALSIPDSEERPMSPAAYMWAWRNSLAAQIHHFQESTQWAMPNLPTLPTLPALPDYQTHPMVRRVSSLFPQRPASRQGNSPIREGWWESLTGSASPSVPAAPPSYSELYPGQAEREDDIMTKKASTMQAAADAAGDLYFGAKETRSKMGSKPMLQTTSPAAPTTRHSQKDRIQRVELSRDRKLFLFWVSNDLELLRDFLAYFRSQIPLLAFVLALMLRSFFSDQSSLSTIYDSVRERVPGGLMNAT